MPGGTNRAFLLDAIERAIESINVDDKIELDICLDRDTTNVPGSPDIANTIFEKISKSHVFIGDVSIINATAEARKTLNPNVAIELGYAAAQLTWDNIICAFNLHYGEIEDLPFDIRQRRIATYTLESGQEKKGERGKLVQAIRSQILHSITSRTEQKKSAQVYLYDVEDDEYVSGEITKRSQLLRPMARDSFLARASLCDFGLEEEQKGNNRLFPAQYLSQSEGEWKSYIRTLLSDRDRVSNGETIVRAVSSYSDPDYFEKVGSYLCMSKLLKEYQIAIENSGDVSLRNVELVMETESREGCIFFDEFTLPEPPQNGPRLLSSPKYPPRTKIDNANGKITIRTGCELIHPKQCISIRDSIYIGAYVNLPIVIKITLYSDDNEPVTSEIKLSFDIESIEMGIEDLAGFDE